MAVPLLSAFAFVLGLGTVVESWYSDRVAKELVYRAWWFDLLLLLLGVNIFFAAVKKWPWKRHQTGFLITHVGLLLLVTGGLFTAMGGTDTTMALVDNDDPGVQESVSQQVGSTTPQGSHEVISRETEILRVRERKDGRDEDRAFPFAPGSLPWGVDARLGPEAGSLLPVLGALAHPLPHSWQAEVGGARLEVLDYYPHARREPYRPAQPDDPDPFAAAKVFLVAPEAMPMQLPNPEHWVAATTKGSVWPLQGVSAVQMLGRCPAELTGEFLSPPTDPGKKGQLVLAAEGHVHRLSVDEVLGRPAVTLGASGWKAAVTKFVADFGSAEAGSEAANPVLRFELTSPSGRTNHYGMVGRMPGKVFAEEARSAKEVAAWFHVPDPRFGQKNRALLQFVTAPDGTLSYRSYSSSKGPFALENHGSAEPGPAYPIWQATGMGWKFRISQYLPRAADGLWLIPEDRRPGFEDPTGQVKPAVRCRMHAGSESREFWLGRTEKDLTPVRVGGREFAVGFNEQRGDLGFEVKLLRAEQTLDPGTNQSASYTSYVQLTDQSRQVEAVDRIVTMNQPLAHAGYKFFQTSLVPMDEPDPHSLKPVCVSVLTVSRDPGLGLKYAGSSMLALGIACMYYMKAYFFKPRGRKPAGAAEGA